MVPLLAHPAPTPPFRTVVQRPYSGSGHSMAAMQQMTRAGEQDAWVRRWAIDVVRGVTPKDYLSEAAALYYDVCARMRYTRDHARTELVAHPRVSLQQRAGDCDDLGVVQAAAWRALAQRRVHRRPGQVALGLGVQSIGNDTQFVAVGFREPQFAGPDPYSHVFVRIQHPKTHAWMVLDPVAGPRTGEMLARVRSATLGSTG